MTAVDDVRVHLHFTMTGWYPLRLVDVLFLPDRALAVEYDYLTPFDLVAGNATERAAAFATTVQREGPAAALDTAERVRELAYADLDAVRVHDGGAFGRVKVDLSGTAGPNLRVRVHGAVDVDAFTDAVRGVLSGHDVPVEKRGGLGLGVVERFRAVAGR